MKTLKKLLSFSIISLIASFSACVAVVGPHVPVPEIPPGSEATPEKAISSLVSVGSFRDVRGAPEGEQISPEGEVTEAVKEAFRTALTKRGARVTPDAPTTIHAEIRTWYATTQGTGAVEVESQATLYFEIHSRDSQRIFSGVYTGSRSSTFPLVSAKDIGDSLGLAMTQAIDQALSDKALIHGLR
jgi:uncharacterized lipoprotein YajG